MQIIDVTTKTLNHPLAAIRAPVQQDLQATDHLIVDELVSDIPLIQQITQHIIKSGGKRLRPLVVLLSARALNYQHGTAHHELAAIIEFVHTATLLHDDVVDESALRRGRNTANAVWGNQASVLVGDFLYSRAFQVLTRQANAPIMQVLANTTNHIAEGEVLQLMNRNDPEINEATYLSIINRKTAQLFSAGAEIGAMLGTQDRTLQQAMANYGLNLGLAFQIIDDLLDYTATATQMGKNVGDDLNEGKATLPLIYALHHSDNETAAVIRHAIQHGGLEQLERITHAMRDTNAFAYTRQQAQHYAQQAHNALQIIPNNPYRNALQQLLTFVIERDH